MLVKKLFIIYFSLWLPVAPGLSFQHSDIDSLEKQLETVNDTLKIEIYNKLSRLHREISLKSSMNYAKEALKIAEAMRYPKGIADAFDEIGNVYAEVEIWDDALMNYMESKRIREQAGDKNGMTLSYSNVGICYFHTRRMTQSREFFQKAMVMAEEIHTDSLLANAYRFLGGLYKSSGEYKHANDLLNKALLLYEKMNDPQRIIIILNLIGSNLKQSGQPSKALRYYTRSIKLAKKFNDLTLLSTTENLMGNACMETGNMEKALMFFSQSLDHATETKNKTLINSIYRSFCHYYVKTGNFKEAYRFDTIYYKLKDSLFRVRNTNKIAQLKEIYDTENKDKELAVLKSSQTIENLKIKHRRTFKNYMTAFIIILFLMTITGLYYLYHKRKTNKILSVKNKHQEETNLLLVESKKQLMEINDTKNKFMSIIAHDLISPFNALLGFTELLAKEAKSYHIEDIKKYSGIISQSSKNLYRLLENLLQWSKSQRGIIDFHPEFFDLGKTVSNLVTFFELSARKKKIKLSEDLKRGNIVYADTNLVSTILRNLIS
ncbi:MAG: tetratricopeptide repeat-containing sensor histidine kinase, partial [Bacteroidales bacterium]|nr:tetratricopeptide repeat-containing sensor histidine kinase [Bacteroidales bacterium]